MNILQTTRTPGRTAIVDDRTCLFFSGFAYLGLHQHPGYQAALCEAIGQYGALFPSSRAGNLRLSIYEETEATLATLLQQESAAVFSSGYLASQTAAHYAVTYGQLLYAPGTHPSLQLVRQQTPSPAVPAEDWAARVTDLVNHHHDHTYVIVTDAVNPVTSTIHPFNWLRDIRKQVLVLIDDSHGLGILGPEGQGIIHLLPQTPYLRYLLTASLAKAFSTEGGVVAGSTEDISALRQTAFFTASTPLLPAYAAAFLQSRPWIKEARETLLQHIAYMLHRTAGSVIHNPHGLPAFVLPHPEGRPDVADHLFEKNIIISSFCYPYAHSPLVNRAVLSALHRQEDLEALLLALWAYGYEI